MNLIALDIDTIALGRPLPFSLRSPEGTLLAPKGYVIRSRQELESMRGRGVQLCVDTDESPDSRRQYVNQLQQMVRQDSALGQIAQMRIQVAGEAGAPAEAALHEKAFPDWAAQQLLLTQLLRSPHPQEGVARLQALHQALVRHVQEAPDKALLALIYLSGQETRMYCATHALLVAVVVTLVAHETLRWPPQQAQQAGQVALTMNIAMAALQDQLAEQAEPLTAVQMDAVHSHGERGAALLRTLGVQDSVWLQAVHAHHERTPGPLAGRPVFEQIARLIQRADLFGARIAPRATRQPMSVTAAMQACYKDEQNQADEAGAALVKTLGLYPPGTFVRLASQEVAVVLRRGANAITPAVAVLRGREGLPTSEPIPRDTALEAYRITAPVAQREVRVQMPLPRLLAL